MVRIPVSRVRLIAGRFFWRPTPTIKALGFSAVALGDDPDVALRTARQLNAAVEEAKRGREVSIPQAPGSVRRLVKLYQESPPYKKLAPNTQRGYDSILAEIERVAGHIQVARITRKDLAETYRKLQPRGVAIAAAHMRIWRIILGHAWNEGWRQDNPAKGMKLETVASRERVWSPAEVEQFCRTADAEGRSSIGLAVRLMLDIGQRSVDVLRLMWSQYANGGFEITQTKTKKRIVVPLLPATRELLDGLTRTSTHVVVSEATKRPYKMDHFRHEYARLRSIAKLPADLQVRDLRRTAATELGAAGATDDEIRAVTGHTSRGVVAVYVRPDDRMARAAQEKRTKGEPKWQK